MNIVHELASNDQRTEQPGIYVLPGWQFGVKPRQNRDGQEMIPFEWATEWPPLADFIMRFPQYWKADTLKEQWIGGPFNPIGIYWTRYDPRSVGRKP